MDRMWTVLMKQRTVSTLSPFISVLLSILCNRMIRGVWGDKLCCDRQPENNAEREKSARGMEGFYILLPSKGFCKRANLLAQSLYKTNHTIDTSYSNINRTPQTPANPCTRDSGLNRKCIWENIEYVSR